MTAFVDNRVDNAPRKSKILNSSEIYTYNSLHPLYPGGYGQIDV